MANIAINILIAMIVLPLDILLCATYRTLKEKERTDKHG